MSMSDEDCKKGRSYFRGHPTILAGGAWLYEDNNKPTPGWGGENRPCKKCGSSKWSGDGCPDECLGILPGVDNACCGHGVDEKSYIRFTDGTMITGFSLCEKKDE